MIDRIGENEEKLDRVSKVVSSLEKALNDFESIKNHIEDINNYYGSKEWFNDKKMFEQGLLNNIKAGILSEDAVWNVNEDIRDLLEKMIDILKCYGK